MHMRLEGCLTGSSVAFLGRSVIGKPETLT